MDRLQNSPVFSNFFVSLFPCHPHGTHLHETRMKASCIIPTRDRRDLVTRAIASVYAQQGPRPEIIVVDDGSNDDTVEYVTGLYPEITLCRLDGRGPGPARNAGAALAGSDIFLFLDSDDYWLPDHTRKLQAVLGQGFQVAYATTLTRDLIGCGSFLIPEQGQGTGDCFNDLARWCFLVPSTVAVTREAFAAVGGFGAETAGEDWCFFLKLADRYPFGFAGPEPTVHRFLHQGSICHCQGPAGIRQTVDNVGATLAGCGKSGPADLRRFDDLRRWLEENDRDWATVQEWYQAMRAGNLL